MPASVLHPALGELTLGPGQREAAEARALRRPEPYDVSGLVLDRVDRQAALTPDRPALSEGSKTVGYAELAGRVRAFADQLRRAGVTASDVVAVGGVRGFEVVDAFLALELLGAVYLPLDAAWPAARVAQVLSDSGARLLVVTGSAEPGPEAQGLPASEVERSLTEAARSTNCPTLVPRSCRTSSEPRASAPTATRQPEPDEVRYLLYTSGSTGRPKGALVEQRGMLNHLWAKVDDLDLGPDDRLAQTAPLGFDISVW